MTATIEAPRELPRIRPGIEPFVALDGVSIAFDDHVVLRDLSFSVQKGRMKVVLGVSGAGKSVVLKLILGLLKPDAGRITVNGTRIDDSSEEDLMRVRKHIGMLFQEGALFDSLTVADNVGYTLVEHGGMSEDDVRRRVEEVLGALRLDAFIDRMPSELSGGQRRRVALARAIAARPPLLLIDEPTSGLDPITALAIDHEIIKLRDLEHVTAVVVTHQLRDAFYVATHKAVVADGRVTIEAADELEAREVGFILLKDGRVHFEGSVAELRASTDPYVKKFLS